MASIDKYGRAVTIAEYDTIVCEHVTNWFGESFYLVGDFLEDNLCVYDYRRGDEHDAVWALAMAMGTFDRLVLERKGA